MFESASDKELQYSNVELKKLEQSIQKLKDSMRSTDSVRNSKAFDQRTGDVKNSSNSDNITSGKYWAKKVSSLGKKENEGQRNRLSKLGGNTNQNETIKLHSKVSDQPGKAIFGMATYRGSKDSSFKNDSGEDTLERASNSDTINYKALNSSRNKQDPSLIYDRGEKKQTSDKKIVVLSRDRSILNTPLYCIANTVKSFNSKGNDTDEQLKSNRNINSFMNKVRAKNDKHINNKDYFSFSSPNRDPDKENGKENCMKSHYPDSQFYPSLGYNSNTQDNENSKVRTEYMKSDMNMSLRSGYDNLSIERNSREEAQSSYLLLNEQEKNPLTADSLYEEPRPDNWNERVKILGKELNSYSSREKMQNSKANVQEKLKLLVKNVKRNSSINNEDNDTSYHYKKKRGSSLQRFQEQENQKIAEDIYQRRSFNVNQQQTLDKNLLQKDAKGQNLVVNTILKENITKYDRLINDTRKINNNEMPLQKLRMKQKPNYLKSNFVKTNEEIKANLKKKINNYQDILKRNFYKNNPNDREVKTETSGEDRVSKYIGSSASATLSSSFMKRSEVDKRDRYNNIKNVAYDRIGSKSPATRRKTDNHENQENKLTRKNGKFNNIPRHAPKVFELDQPHQETDRAFKKRFAQKNEYYDGRRSNFDASSSSDSSISRDINKRGLNIRRTITNIQRSKDSSISSSPGRDFISKKKDKQYYNMYSNQNNFANNYKKQIEFEEKQYFKTNESNGDIYDKYNAIKVANKSRSNDINIIV
jgi:hypothetical protein